MHVISYLSHLEELGKDNTIDDFFFFFDKIVGEIKL